MPLRGRPRNPLGQTPDRLHTRSRVVIARAGETPGLQDINLVSLDSTAPGTIRRNWRQSVNMIPAPPPFNVAEQPATITRALRYKASSTFLRAGNDNTRFGRRRAVVPPTHPQRPVTLAAGNKQNQPTVRNRLSSFGQRVPALNAGGGG